MIDVFYPGYYFQNEYDYLVKVLFENFLQAEWRYAGVTEGLWTFRHHNIDLIFPNLLFPEQEPTCWLTEVMLHPQAHLTSFVDGMMLTPYQKEGESSFNSFDLPGSVFFFLAAIEECWNLPRSAIGNLLPEETFLGKNDLCDLPVVDIYLENFYLNLKRYEFPCTRGKHNYAFHYSCDVDSPTIWYKSSSYNFVRYALASLIKHKSLQRFTSTIKARNKIQNDLFYTFHYIFEQLYRYGMRGAFNIRGGVVATHYDKPYSLNEEHIQTMLREIREHGHETGFHPSYSTKESYSLFLEELERVRAAAGQPVYGGRQHYLRFSGSRTWRMWDDAGLSYDSTCGYNSRTGFRMGTCRPFPVYDLQDRKALKLVEYPLIIMDCALCCQHPNFEHACEHAAKLNAWVRKFNGVMTLLWHNSFFETTAKKRLFEHLLHICA